VRVLAALALVLAVAVPAGAATPATELRITLWPRGQSAADRHFWTLSCAPVRGSLPNRANACARLARLDAPFARIPADSACTEQYGGPAEARVTGVFRGRRVWARFDRRNGCGIGRWQKHAFLLGGVPLPVE
jgi:hypothetical protein